VTGCWTGGVCEDRTENGSSRSGGGEAHVAEGGVSDVRHGLQGVHHAAEPESDARQARRAPGHHGVPDHDPLVRSGRGWRAQLRQVQDDDGAVMGSCSFLCLFYIHTSCISFGFRDVLCILFVTLNRLLYIILQIINYHKSYQNKVRMK
jgi:hypothetical protein